MASPGFDFTHEVPIQRFLEFLEKSFEKGYSIGDGNDKYIPNSKFKSYFSDPETLQRILKVVFPDDNGRLRDLRSQIQEGYKKCFAILLRMNEPRLITRFVECPELADQHLPFYSRPSQLPSSINGDAFFKKFSEHQWAFCAPVLKYQRFTRRQEHILPFKIIEPISDGKGGGAQTDKIEVHPEYDMLRSHSQNDAHAAVGHYYVIKKYPTDTAEQDCRNETDGFVDVSYDPRDASGIIGFYGGWNHNGAFSILLEYANEGSLEEYFCKGKGPLSMDEFWRSFGRVCWAVKRIHNVRKEGHTYEGWHQDIKPRNILVFSCNGQLEFKLSDFDLARVRKKHGHRVVGLGSRGTRTYGAPECYEAADNDKSPAHHQVTGKIDIWSLACVLSEVAVWAKYDFDELEKYREDRRAECERLSMGDLDCFHDGHTVSRPVKETLRSVVNRCEADGDTLTKDIVELITTALVPEEDRLNCKEFCGKLDSLFGEHTNRISPPRLSPGEPPYVRASRATSSATISSAPDSSNNATDQLGFLSMNDAIIDRQRQRRESRGNRLRRASSSIKSVFYPDVSGNNWRRTELADRDHVFLLDDASSMKYHWDDVLSTLDVLAYKVKKMDKNGLDLYFMINLKSCEGVKDSTKLVKFAEKYRPDSTEQYSNIDNALSKIIGKYQDQLSTRHAPVRPMTVYVLTDGRWQSKVRIEKNITALAKSLEENNKPSNQFGIQFIQFGNDPTGTERLRCYDEALCNRYDIPRDLVDTEPFNGNVWKMLLGSINRTADKD